MPINDKGYSNASNARRAAREEFGEVAVFHLITLESGRVLPVYGPAQDGRDDSIDSGATDSVAAELDTAEAEDSSLADALAVEAAESEGMANMHAVSGMARLAEAEAVIAEAAPVSEPVAEAAPDVYAPDSGKLAAATAAAEALARAKAAAAAALAEAERAEREAAEAAEAATVYVELVVRVPAGQGAYQGQAMARDLRLPVTVRRADTGEVVRTYAPEGMTGRRAATVASRPATVSWADRAKNKVEAARDAGRRGELPPRPDLSAPLHQSPTHQARWANIFALAEAGDTAGLKAVAGQLVPYSTRPKQQLAWIELAVEAIQARAAN